MGFIINDSLTLPNGLTVKGAYASLSGQPINLIKSSPFDESANADFWIVTSNYNIWANKESATTRKLNYINQDFVKTIINDPNQSIFPALYTAMKAKYTSTTDC
jgi:hypothetical protein